MKKIIKISLVVVMIVSITLLSFKYIENIEADSGWDSSYDSSWDSGSDWGGSSWDNDYDYDYDYDDDYDYNSGYSGGSSYNYEGDTVVVLIPFLLIVVFTLVIALLPKKSNRKNTDREKRRREYLSRKNEVQHFDKLTQLQVDEIIPNLNIEEFNFKAYQIFYDVQMAWMNFDYDKLKELLTDELYNNYVMQLDALKLKNHKNTMKGFELIDSYICNLKEENDKYIAEVYLQVRFFDYVENSKTGMILRGSPNRKLNNCYKLTFIRTKDESNNINECPRCGAPVEGNSTGICEYCKSKLINDNYNWVMSKKEIVRQK